MRPPRRTPPARARSRPTPERFLHIGEITRPHGLKGALVVFSHTRPAIGIAGYSFWWVGPSAGAAKRHRVIRCWQHGRRILAQLEGVDDVAAAEALRGARIWIPAEAVDVAEDEYLWADLIGCDVVREDGSLVGRVTALSDFGAQDILLVRAPAETGRPGEWMLPFTEQVVREVDVAARRIVVVLPEGMDACFTPRS